MKKLFLLSALVLVVASGLFLSCQKNEIVSPEEGLRLKSAATYPVDGCASVCIEPGSGDYYAKGGTFTGAIGSNTKTIGYTVYNTETDFIVILSFNRTPANSGSGSTIKVTVNAAEQTKTITNGNSATYTFPLASGWAACDVTSWSLVETVFDGQSAISGNGTYELIGLCGGCEESFTYIENEDGSYTFTYIPEEDMVGAELVFTFAQSAYQSGFPVEEAWAQAGQGQTMHATMDLTACEVYTWTVALKANCSGHSEKSNVWTDFKVNEHSKKNNPEDKFVQVCP